MLACLRRKENSYARIRHKSTGKGICTMTEKLKESDYINSIIRTTNILNLYRTLNVEQLGVTDISRELGLHKTTVFRIVKTLEHVGWLVQDYPNGKYRLGSKLIILSSIPTSTSAVDDTIQQEMRQLRNRFNEDVVLTGLFDGHLAICLEKMRANNVLHISSRVGRSIGMTRGSTGKVLLAYLPEKAQERAIQMDSPNLSEEERQKLFQALEKIRRTGYCISTSERDEGVSSVTVPLFDRSGNIIYSLAILGEEKRMESKNMDEMLQELNQAARRIQDMIAAV